MTSKHTQGPWEYDGPQHNIIVWSSPENRICFMTSDGPTEANARLIAAAPEMLAALKKIVFDWDGEPEDMAEAREAIAKAEGRS